MMMTAPQPIRLSWRAVGLLLAVSVLLTAQLSCLAHWLLVDAPRVGQAPMAQIPTLLRTQHAAEVWSGAPCTCETEHLPAPMHAEPLAPTLALLASAIVVPALVSRAGVLRAPAIARSGRAVAPATPPPQA